MQTGLLGSLWTKLADVISGFFAIIPQIMYFFFASIASLLDLFQCVFRKVAGLDVYYYNGVATSDDIITEFIEGLIGINNKYSALTTVFWSLILFGFIVLILMTIITIIKAHYNYDSKKSSPMYILKSTLKATFTMFAIPAVTVLGLYLGTVLFRTLDTITTPASQETLEGHYEADAIVKFKKVSLTKNGGGERFASYDFFGSKESCNTETFSGILFKACTKDANRVRYGSYSVSTVATKDENGQDIENPDTTNKKWDNAGVFYTTKTENQKEIVATQIDFAFANNLTLIDTQAIQYKGYSEAEAAIGSTLAYGPSATFSAGLKKVTNFSKFNVGLVWYYYNLWAFNYILGYTGAFLCITLFTNVLFGLVMRIIISAFLFAVYPPLVGITPFDEGHAVQSWRSQFISYIVSAYASVVGMNIIFLMLPIMETIQFFNIGIIDSIVQMILIIAALTVVTHFVEIVSKFIGAKNINELGSQVKKEGANPVMRGIGATVATGSASVFAAAIPIVAVGSAIKNDPDSQKQINNAKEKIGKFGNKIKNSKFVQSIKNSRTKIKRAAGQNTLSGKFVRFGQKFGHALYDPARMILGLMGVPINDVYANNEYEEVVETDEDGNEVVIQRLKGGKGVDKDGKSIKRKSFFKALQEGVVDLSKVALKGAGEITGAKQFIDSLDKSTKAVEIYREHINSFAQLLHNARYGGQKPFKPPLKTESVKEEKEINEAVNDAVPTIFDTVQEINESKRFLQQIKEIVKEAKK